MNSEKKVFISYAREDLNTAKQIYTEIKNAGGLPWLDQEDLLPGQDWEIEISNAIRKCSYFIAIISERSVSKRGYIQKELLKALSVLEELPPGMIYIIPARLDDSEPSHKALGKLHRVDLFPSMENGLKKILKSLSLLGTPKASNEFLATQPSFQEIKNKVKESAACDHPNDFATQKFVINKQLEAWEKLKSYRPLGIPDQVFNI